jgi:transcriptional regulator of acetoin/glycerol metabolism
VEQCQQAGLEWGEELYFDATHVLANAALDSLVPRFAVEAQAAMRAHLEALFAEESAQEAAEGPSTSAETPAKIRLAMAAMGKPETNVAALCAELGVSRQTLYRHVSPEGKVRPDGEKLLAQKR